MGGAERRGGGCWHLMAGVAIVIAGCAERTASGPLVTAAPQPAPGAVMRGSRLELRAIFAHPTCPSPYRLAQVQATLIARDGTRQSTPTHIDEQGRLAPRPGALGAGGIGWYVSFGQLTADLMYTAPVDVLPLLASDLVINARLLEQPAVTAQLAIPPRYDCPRSFRMRIRRRSAP